MKKQWYAHTFRGLADVGKWLNEAETKGEVTVHSFRRWGDGEFILIASIQPCRPHPPAMRLGLECPRCQAVTEIRFGDLIPCHCVSGCCGVFNDLYRQPRLVEYTGEVECKSIGALDTPARVFGEKRSDTHD